VPTRVLPSFPTRRSSDLSGTRIVAAIVLAKLEDGAQLPLPRRLGQAEIEEARAGDLHRGDRVARRQGLDQRLCQRARVRLRRLEIGRAHVAGEVAVGAVLGTLDDEVRDRKSTR